jgi:hypothetical protein
MFTENGLSTIMDSRMILLMEPYLDFFYANEIMDSMFVKFKNRCYGCQNGLLSQRDHPCLTLTVKQQLELYFDDIVYNLRHS